MDYEKKHNEVINALKSLIEDGRQKNNIVIYIEDIERKIPELTESKDERIREEIIEFLRHCVNEHHIVVKAKWFAWLEKQDSNILWHDVSEKPEEQREIFCEWRGSDDVVWHDVAFYHADTKTFWNGEQQIEDVVKWIYVNEMFEKQGEQKPQRMISAEAKEALYDKPSWSDPDNLIEESHQQQADDLIDMVTEKPNWSEEDENIKEDIILNLQENYRNKYINERTCLDEIHWLKSIKERLKGE